MLKVRRILLPTDGSACAAHAAAHAVELARRHGAALHVLHVRHPAHGDAADGVPAMPPGDLDGVTVVRAEVVSAPPMLGILDYAQTAGADLVVMGTHGRTGLDRLLLGSVTEDVVRLAACPVLTVRADAPPAGAVRRVLAPVDFSPSSWLAVAYAEHLAALFGARLDLLHVVETLPSYGLVDIPAAFPPPSREVAAEGREALLDLAREAGGPPVAVEPHVVAGHPTIALIEAAQALAPDLIVLPTHGRSGLKRMVLGSVAEQLVRRAPCPVLVVRGQGRGLLPGDPSGDGATIPLPLPTPPP
jgi:nucleotide-binding universal stress UspA family protein